VHCLVKRDELNILLYFCFLILHCNKDAAFLIFNSKRFEFRNKYKWSHQSSPTSCKFIMGAGANGKRIAFFTVSV
jgi:hypothetical protein